MKLTLEVTSVNADEYSKFSFERNGHRPLPLCLKRVNQSFPYTRFFSQDALHSLAGIHTIFQFEQSVLFMCYHLSTVHFGCDRLMLVCLADNQMISHYFVS